MSCFGFGSNFRTWIQILYKNPKAAVMTNCIISPFFNILRSTRPGCSISPLLFTIFLEPLVVMIRANPAIKGVKGAGEEHKLLLYAPDILSLINDPVISLPSLMNTIQEYSNLSGYKINCKSEAMPISKTCYSNTTSQFGFKWVPNGMKYLGVKLSPDLDKIISLNYELLLNKIKNNLEKWGTLNYPYGGQ